MEPFKGKEPTATPANFSVGPRVPRKIPYRVLLNSYRPKIKVAIGNLVADCTKFKVGVCLKKTDKDCTIQCGRKHHVADLGNCVGVPPRDSFVQDAAGRWYQIYKTQTKVCVLFKLYSLRNKLKDNNLDSNGEEELTREHINKMFEDSSDDADEEAVAHPNSNGAAAAAATGATGTSTSEHHTSTSKHHTSTSTHHTSTSTAVAHPNSNGAAAAAATGATGTSASKRLRQNSHHTFSNSNGSIDGTYTSNILRLRDRILRLRPQIYGRRCDC